MHREFIIYYFWYTFVSYVVYFSSIAFVFSLSFQRLFASVDRTNIFQVMVILCTVMA